MALQIVPMDSSHVKDLAGLEKLCFSSPWSADSLMEELENSFAFFLVAFFEDEMAGYIGIQEIAGECNITSIAVLPEFRRKGIAQAMLTAAEAGARERNCGFITLEVRLSNNTAIALYRKNGFIVAGERKDFYSNPVENALLMTKVF